MKKTLLILALSQSVLTGARAGTSFPLVDHFPYSSGNLGFVGGGGGWSGSSSAAVLATGNIDGTALGLPASSGGQVAMSTSTGGTYNLFATASGDVAAGKVYCSFLIKVNDASTATGGKRIISINIQNGSTPRYLEFWLLNVSGAVQPGIAKNGGTPTYVTSGTGSNLADGSPYFVVVSYEFLTGSTTDDVVKLWVNPGSLGSASEDPAPRATTSTGNDPTSATGMGRLYFNGGVAGNIDELRMGANWADVAPSGGPLTATKLGFTTQPVNTAPSAAMSPVVVQVQSSGGAPVATNNVPVTIALTSGSGPLNGTLTRNTDSTGKATFNDLSIDTAGTGKQLTASASGIGTGLTAALSSTFSIVVPSISATKLAFTTQPANAAVSATMAPVVVQAQDSSSVAVATNNVPITIALTTGSGNLSGTLTRNTDATGKATFNDLSIDTAGTGDQLTASASPLTSAVSTSFNITTLPSGGLTITGERMNPSGFIVDGENSTPSVFCQILGSSDPAAVETNWVIVSYQNFDASAHITFTNPVAAAMPQVVYRLRTGDTTTKLQPPSIGIPPASQIVSAGATATFTVTASGPVLHYLWYFAGNPIAGATTSSLVIPNAQAPNAGNYYVQVANPAGYVNSAIATLGIGNVAPTITSHPQHQSVSIGGTAIFTGAATGTSPLGYQWYHNTSTLLAAQTSAHLTLNNVTTNQAGQYSLNVSNAYGSVRSSNATLTVTATPTGLPQTNLVGFAAVAGVTGGTGGPDVIATNYAALRAYCRAAGPIIIHIPEPLVANESYTYVEGRDKTIVGDGTNAALYGDLRLSGTNIIVANLFISATNSNSDGITIDNSSHGIGRSVWVDHCTFYACRDGSLDVTKGADYVTVSWCKFSYEAVPDGVVNHEFVNLIGSSDSDNAADYHVTFHHNWYGDYCRERMPSVRFGRVHVFNNYYNCQGNNYCVRTRINAQVLVENNYYIGVQNPWERFVTSGSPGLLKASGNITNSCTFLGGWTSGAVVIPGTDTLTDPSLTTSIYPYVLDTNSDVPYWIQTYAGSGKYPYVP